jgi:hypothetical protein
LGVTRDSRANRGVAHSADRESYSLMASLCNFHGPRIYTK